MPLMKRKRISEKEVKPSKLLRTMGLTSFNRDISEIKNLDNPGGPLE